MASEFDAVSVAQVASHFVRQYYQTLKQQPDQAFRFYKESSSMDVVDGKIIKSATDLGQIHNIIMSLQFPAIEIKTIGSQESLSKGIFVVVSGSVVSENFSGRRKFVQSFFLAPQVGGYFVLNDILHILDEEAEAEAKVEAEAKAEAEVEAEAEAEVEAEAKVEDEAEAEVEAEAAVEAEAEAAVEAEAEAEVEATISSLQDTPVHTAEGEDGINVDADHLVRDHTTENCSFQENQQDENSVHGTVEVKTLEEASEIVQIAEDSTQGSLGSEEETDGKQEKPSYASILRAAGGQPRQTARVVRPPQKPIQQFGDESSSHREGHSKSIYAGNLPSSATYLDVWREFRTFGKVRPDGIRLVNNKVTGFCYCFVEFEDVQGAQNALKASPIMLGGKQVYIQRRR